VKCCISKNTLLGCVVLHLVLVTLSAFYIRVADEIPGKTIIDFYRKASGAGSSYGFFAPSIGVKVRGLFDVVNEDGTKLTNIPLVPEAEREVQIRLGGIFDEFTSEKADDADFRQPLAASLAASIFSRHATASEVVLHVQEYWPKTMAEYRSGQRADWSDYYAARFARTQGQGGDAQ
jgi:hypothetical protein